MENNHEQRMQLKTRGAFALEGGRHVRHRDETPFTWIDSSTLFVFRHDTIDVVQDIRCEIEVGTQSGIVNWDCSKKVR